MTESFLKGPLAGQLFRFALPSATMYLSFSCSFPCSSALSLGTNVTLAQAVGARKEAAARKILHTSLLFSVLIGLVFAGIGEIIVRPLLACYSLSWLVTAVLLTLVYRGLRRRWLYPGCQPDG